MAIGTRAPSKSGAEAHALQTDSIDQVAHVADEMGEGRVGIMATVGANEADEEVDTNDAT